MNLEHQYIAITSLQHRKRFCQFYTPQAIAKFMLQWVLEKNPKTLYDPAFGMGAFYYASQSLKFTGQFIATELDAQSFDFYRQYGRTDKLELINSDYFEDWDNQWEAIICNPPYLRFQKYENKDDILKKLGHQFEEKISGYTNIASAFLLKSVAELKQGGRMAYIMPFEFLNTGYGTIVKDILLKHGHIHSIIQVKDETGTFTEVTTTVCIIFFEKNTLKQDIVFSSIESSDSIIVKNLNMIKPNELNPKTKWLTFFDTTLNISTHKKFNKNLVPITYYGKFKRGIATGANEFFALRRSEIEKLGILSAETAICLTKSQQVKSAVFNEDDLNLLIEKDEPIFVFNPTTNFESLSPEAKNYISFGEQQGYHERYLTKTRKYWYMLEKRPPFGILFGVFSRGGYKVIRNTTQAISLTCFHGFEATGSSEKYLDKLFLFLKSEIGNTLLHENKRVYGKSLDKFEPSDLNNVLVPTPAFLDSICNRTVENLLARIAINNDKNLEEINILFSQLGIDE